MRCPDVPTNIVGNNITNNTIKQIVTTKLPPLLLERYISFKKDLGFAIQVYSINIRHSIFMQQLFETIKVGLRYSICIWRKRKGE